MTAMTAMDVAPRVLDLRPSEHVYFHPEFHGALARAIVHLDQRYGPGAAERFLRRVARNVFGGLADSMRREGLDALEGHWRSVFAIEGGECRIEREPGLLTLTVDDCPVVRFLQRTGRWLTPRFCEATVVVNDELCRMAGLECSCRYKPGAGRCVQRFWHPAPAGNSGGGTAQ